MQCGIQGLGIKVCDCVGEQGEQVYDNCRCPKPEQLAIAAKVPGCASLPAPTGPQQADVPSCAGLEEPEACIERFAGFPCATLWQACVGVDPSAPTDSGSGCVCLPAIDADGSFEQDATVGTWSCGPTNDWFSRDEAI